MHEAINKDVSEILRNGRLVKANMEQYPYSLYYKNSVDLKYLIVLIPSLIVIIAVVFSDFILPILVGCVGIWIFYALLNHKISTGPKAKVIIDPTAGEVRITYTRPFSPTYNYNLSLVDFGHVALVTVPNHEGNQTTEYDIVLWDEDKDLSIRLFTSKQEHVPRSTWQRYSLQLSRPALRISSYGDEELRTTEFEKPLRHRFDRVRLKLPRINAPKPFIISIKNDSHGTRIRMRRPLHVIFIHMFLASLYMFMFISLATIIVAAVLELSSETNGTIIQTLYFISLALMFFDFSFSYLQICPGERELKFYKYLPILGPYHKRSIHFDDLMELDFINRDSSFTNHLNLVGRTKTISIAKGMKEDELAWLRDFVLDKILPDSSAA
ncbi:hypothetical protein V5T82_14430 [Magnetovibrio sp. PR-2]|uniref:hypothetical protein n=1 Tax=Magnetovibrio sp. PR-2 TaxID=3120356 RepID=UPI002FCE68EF